MRLRNARGRPVDPVPFLVVAALAFLVCFSYGPGYFMALGLTLRQALAAATAVFLAAAAAAYYRLVWTTRPELRGEVPADLRLRRLAYAVLVGVLVVVLLALPLLARGR